MILIGPVCEQSDAWTVTGYSEDEAATFQDTMCGDVSIGSDCEHSDDTGTCTKSLNCFTMT